MGKTRRCESRHRGGRSKMAGTRNDPKTDQLREEILAEEGCDASGNGERQASPKSLADDGRGGRAGAGVGLVGRARGSVGG